MSQRPFGIHWFRRDLRLIDNPALFKNLTENAGRVLCVFVLDKEFLSRPDFSKNRFAFFLKTLSALQSKLQSVGSDLLILDEGPQVSLSQLFRDLKPTTLSFNRDYEPFARTRDEKISELCASLDIKVITSKDHLLIEPHEIQKATGGYYQVFTPFFNNWRRLIKNRVFTQTPKFSKLDLSIDFSKDMISQYMPKTHVPLPPAGEDAAQDTLKTFLLEKIDRYQKARDVPSENSTSRLSVYLKNGSINSALILKSLLKYDLLKNPNAETFLKEIAWREFYYHILFHRPDVEHQAYLPKYQSIRWENDEAKFKAWCEGQTGYPIVDAGMRELLSTGFMHNRVRMIVASFLTKDLLIDWRQGERHFMKHLLDGDLAPNNGGWQWAASTGCDPQPYFRIFNPELQSQKFDPEGLYIKQHVPELRHLSAREIHNPRNDQRMRYPQAIVEHAAQKIKALRLYKN